MNISRAKGTKDIFFNEMKIWQYLENNIREICSKHNVNEIRTPIFESTELFQRGVGSETDIVNKEMYTFLDKGDRSITLRPELTAGVVRAYIENGFGSLSTPVKLWYTGTIYRYEKMQKGRYREFSQFGVEIFGSNSYLADIETISLAYELFTKLELMDKLTLSINSIGCKDCRDKYIKILKEFLKDNIDNMCENCKTRYIKNPMRIIDCKENKCKVYTSNIPTITDNLCLDCAKDFDKLKETLTNMNINYVVDKTIVRGLDYYNKTVYEFVSKDLNLAVGGGGRYDTLTEVLGGNITPAVGFGLGMDRIVILLNEYNLMKEDKNIDIYIAVLEESIYPKIFELSNKLREVGYIVEMDLCLKSFNAQMKYADKIKCNYTLIIGEDEIKNNSCTIKNMNTGDQVNVNFDIESIKKVIK